MKEHKHKPSGTIARFYAINEHYKVEMGSWTGYLPRWIVEQGSDWEEVKTPLFVTEDKVVIYDPAQMVHLVLIERHAKPVLLNVSAKAFAEGKFEGQGWVALSSHNARVDYIRMHDRLFSVTDIATALGWDKEDLRISTLTNIAGALLNKNK